MQMPPLDPAILARRSEIVAALRTIVSGEGVIDDQDVHERQASGVRFARPRSSG